MGDGTSHDMHWCMNGCELTATCKPMTCKKAGIMEAPSMTTPQAETEALLPCPWCGCKPEKLSITEGSTFRWRLFECPECGAGPGEVRVQTMGGGKHKDWDAKAILDGIAAWNTRAALPPKPVESVDAALARIPAGWALDHLCEHYRVADGIANKLGGHTCKLGTDGNQKITKVEGHGDTLAAAIMDAIRLAEEKAHV